jgi:hypothetical protein
MMMIKYKKTGWIKYEASKRHEKSAQHFGQVVVEEDTKKMGESDPDKIQR